MIREYRGQKCKLEIKKYEANGNTAIVCSTLDNQCIFIGTVNICKLDAEFVAIKNYSENEGVEEWLLENNIIDYKVGELNNGYITVPVYKLHKDVIEKIN